MVIARAHRYCVSHYMSNIVTGHLMFYVTAKLRREQPESGVVGVDADIQVIALGEDPPIAPRHNAEVEYHCGLVSGGAWYLAFDCEPHLERITQLTPGETPDGAVGAVCADEEFRSKGPAIGVHRDTVIRAVDAAQAFDLYQLRAASDCLLKYKLVQLLPNRHHADSVWRLKPGLARVLASGDEIGDNVPNNGLD
jgi:hypothetical protein